MAHVSSSGGWSRRWREVMFSSCMRRQFSYHFRQFPFAPCFDSLNVVFTNGSRSVALLLTFDASVSRFLSSRVRNFSYAANFDSSHLYLVRINMN
jgi:hypothetical protein